MVYNAYITLQNHQNFPVISPEKMTRTENVQLMPGVQSGAGFITTKEAKDNLTYQKQLTLLNCKNSTLNSINCYRFASVSSSAVISLNRDEGSYQLSGVYDKLFATASTSSRKRKSTS